MCPDVYRSLARHPAALEGFAQSEAALREQRRLTLAEQALVALEVSVARGCHYCRDAFELEARQSGVDESSIARVSAGEWPDSPVITVCYKQRGALWRRKAISAKPGRPS